VQKLRRSRGRIRASIKDNGLRLHTDKTHIGDCRKRGEGFEFLGYRFEPGGRYVRKNSLDRLKDSIRAKTRRSCGQSLARVIESLNRTLRGWFNYFKHAHHRTFTALGQFIRRRLRAILRKHAKRLGFGKTHADHRQWPNAFFVEAGLLALHTALQDAKHSRCGNH
jgi:RNA-directed DNA polymerase